MNAARHPTGILLASLAAALLLTVLPLPFWAAEWRPQWVALILLYWALFLPERVGVFWAWSTGVVLDGTSGTTFGQHALSLSVMAWLAVELHKRIRVFPLVQQALSVWILLLVERLLSMWVMGATGRPTPSLLYWMSTLLGLLLWPALFFLLRPLSERLRVP